MAQRTLGTKIEVSGEKEYKQAISNINASLGVLNSEMKKTSAQYADNATSVEALTKKGDILERTLLTQKDKVEELRQALLHAKQEYGEADNRTMKWEKSLNEAEAQVYQTEKAIKENNEELKKAQENTEGLGTIVGDVAGKFGITLPENISNALDSVGNFSTGSVIAIGAVLTAITAVVDGYKKLIDMTKESAASADDVMTLSMQTGLDPKTIQELQYAAELIDVPFETIRASLTKLKKNMDSARDGSSELGETFAKLGVEVTNSDGSLRDAKAVFDDVIDALGNVSNATERDTIAMQIFGKKAEDLNPMIIQGSEALNAYMQEAEDVNYVLSNDSLEALGAVDDAYQRLQNTQKGIKDQMSAELAPSVEDLYSTWTDFIDKAGKALVDSGILTELGNILEMVVGLIDPLGEMNFGILPVLKTALAGVADVLAIMADSVKVIFSLATGQFGKVWDMVSGVTPTAYATLQQNRLNAKASSTGSVYDPETGWYTGNYYNASGDYNFVGGRTIVGENGAEAVYLPRGTRIDNAQETRRSNGDVFNITISAASVKEFNDIVRIAKNAEVNSRMRGE